MRLKLARFYEFFITPETIGEHHQHKSAVTAPAEVVFLCAKNSLDSMSFSSLPKLLGSTTSTKEALCLQKIKSPDLTTRSGLWESLQRDYFTMLMSYALKGPNTDSFLPTNFFAL